MYVGVGGFLGANARFLLGNLVQQRVGTAFPWGTFGINITGAFLLGLFLTLVTERLTVPNASAWRLTVAVGFVGAYTTFSTFEYETLALVQTASLFRAFGNALGSLVAGFIAVWMGV